MGAHNGAVDHRILVVGVCGEILKHPLPYTAFGPTAEPQVDLYPVAEPLRQIALRHPGTITIEHGLDEQPIISRGHPDRAFTPGQQVLDPLPLNGGVLEHAQSMAAHESPRTTKLYDRTQERLTQNKVERIRL